MLKIFYNYNCNKHEYKQKKMKEVFLYSDGSSLGNPGPGGYGTILKIDGHVQELSQGYQLTTNNRMELLGVIAGLEQLTEPCVITVTTDSRYVIDGITKWIHSWKKNNWALGATKKNMDLWKHLDALVAKHQIKWVWVRGHQGHVENERCDTLAKNAALHNDSQLVDEVYCATN